MKKFSLAAFLVGWAFIAIGLGIPFLLMRNASIIGGADVHTYSFLLRHGTEGVPYSLLWLGGSLNVIGLFYQLFHNAIAAYCNKWTTLVALSLSAVGAVGLICAFTWAVIVAFNESSRYPVRYPVSIGLGLGALVVFVGLMVSYAFLRRRCPSAKGVLLDVVTACLFLPVFLFSFGILIILL